MPRHPFLRFQKKSTGFTDPSSLSGLHLWLKADAGVLEAASDPAEDGDNVWRWEDQSGQSNHANQTTVADQPSYHTSVQNSLPVVRFASASTEFLDVAHAVALNYANSGDTGRAKTYFVAMEYTTETGMVWSQGSSSSPGGWGGFLGSNEVYNFSYDTSNGSFGRIENDGDINSGAWLVLTIVYDGGLNPTSWKVYLNDTQVDDANLGTTKSDVKYETNDFSIGRRNNAANHLNADIGELVVYDSELSAADQTLVVDYLKNKWGIA